LPKHRILAAFWAASALAQVWVNQQSNTTASLRGISAVNVKNVWASGTGGTYVHTSDGGRTWMAAVVPGAEQLDFRGIHAFNSRTVLLVSSGPGDKSKVYKTKDGGLHWTLEFTNPDAKGFYDAVAFWDARHGIVLGDPVDGRFAIFTTDDGGVTWQKQTGPVALDKEGAFAASNSCLVVRGKRQAWFGTGGPGAARVFHSNDGGKSWSVATTPIRNDSASAGIFSLAFRDRLHGIAVGGDYNKPTETAQNIAVTDDGGKTWTTPKGPPPAGFRSAVCNLSGRMWITVGTSGSDISTDGGQSWKRLDSGSYNAIELSPLQLWTAGPKGRIAMFMPSHH